MTGAVERPLKVVVTGGLGKLGRWVVAELLDTSGGRPAHIVTVFDRVPGPEDQRVRYLAGDVQDLGQVVGALAGADAVIHLAAVPRPGLTTDDVTFRTNVMGAFNVHEAAYRLGVKRVVSASSQAILGWDYRERDFVPAYLPLDEDHPVQPQDAYGLSKEVTEAIARSYARKGLETVVLRPNRIMTPEEIAAMAAEGGRAPNGFRMYSYVDVRDCAAAFRLAIERPVPGHTVLFVVADDSCVARPLAEVLPAQMPAIGDLARALTGTRAAILNRRAKEVLGWRPSGSWRDAGRGDEERAP
ncbi:MAG TPA: NAD(P)-dependent oxidoreductase [Chloroflexota bacterium]|nr:NAD(P)-dependent oxidoreductase [Chloroflexota bacterium]